MTRLNRYFGVGLALATTLAGSLALAETQAEIASKENDAGKDLMFQGKYAEASAKFQDAVARVPEAKYFFNLCTSLYQEGKFGQALTACDSAEKNNPDDRLKEKTVKLEQRIEDEAKSQGITLEPVGGGGGETNVATNPPDGGTTTAPPDGGTTTAPPDGGTTTTPPAGGTTTTAPPAGGTTAAPSYAVGRPPTQGLFQSTKPDNSYTWTLGVDLFGGGGQIGQPDVYGKAESGIRIKADYMVVPAHRVGVQAYLQYSDFGSGSGMATVAVNNLTIADIGVAAYKDFCPLNGRFCLTPLAGVQLALMDPNQDQSSGSQTFNYAAAGARLEANASFAFGSRDEYVVQAMAGLNLYSPVFASPTDGDSAMAVGLDKGGAAVYLGAGFTYRFNTPFGQAPFITLE